MLFVLSGKELKNQLNLKYLLIQLKKTRTKGALNVLSYIPKNVLVEALRET